MGGGWLWTCNLNIMPHSQGGPFDLIWVRSALPVNWMHIPPRTCTESLFELFKVFEFFCKTQFICVCEVIAACMVRTVNM